MGKRLDPVEAKKAFIKRGLIPSEPFPGARERWRSVCVECGKEVKPFYSSVVLRNLGGCKFCGVEKSKLAKRPSDIRKANAILVRKSLALLTTYEGVKAKSLLECQLCGKVHRSTIDSFRAERVCDCCKVPRSPKNPLVVSNPALSNQWHSRRNGKLLPKDVSAKSHRRVWWECSVGHEWEAVIYSRSAGKGCPVCSGRKVVDGVNDLKTLFPQLAEEWDTELNAGFSPELVSPGSNLRFWWRCSKDKSHIWNTSAIKRSSAGTGCPLCALDKFKPGVNDLATVRPDLAAEWSIDRNTENPSEIYISSRAEFYWEGDCGHTWKQRLNNRIRGFGCTVCTGKEVVVGVNDLPSLFPEVAQYFHPTRNDRPPESYVSGTSEKVWWFCDYGHEYESAISNKTRHSTGCPVCSNQLLVPGINDLATGSPQLLERWDFSRNETSPDQFLKSSRSLAWWKCERGHSFSSTIRSMHSEKCPVCVGRIALQGETDLATVRPDLAAQWHIELNSKSPTEVTLGSDYLAWWKDEKGHEWTQRVQTRSRGVGCPECAQVGFSSLKPGVFYYLHHPDYLASKVGITNKGIKSDRLAEFRKSGWNILEKWEHPDGYLIRRIETAVLHWIRKDLGIPPFLSLSEMPRTGGWSETFSHEAVDPLGIKSIVESRISSARVTRSYNSGN